MSKVALFLPYIPPRQFDVFTQRYCSKRNTFSQRLGGRYTCYLCWFAKGTQQLNYTNTAISTIATQLNHVATRVDTPVQTRSSSISTETYANSISKPFFKVESVPRKYQNDFTTAFSNASLLKQISQQIDALNLRTPSTSCIDKTCSQIQQDTSSESEEEPEEEIESEKDTLNVITKTFEEDKGLALNKINYGNKSTMRNYYSRPSPPNLQYEEWGTF